MKKSYVKIKIIDVDQDILNQSLINNPYKTNRTTDGKYVMLSFDSEKIPFQIFSLGYNKMSESEAMEELSTSAWPGEFETANLPLNQNSKSVTVSGIKDPGMLRARIIGIANGLATAGGTKDFDWQIQQLSWLGKNKQSYFDGVIYYAEKMKVGDCIKFQVVDVDGLVYPAGTVLEEFADICIMPGTNTEKLYRAKLIFGMYIRVKYISTGIEDPYFICNLYRHLKENEDL